MLEYKGRGVLNGALLITGNVWLVLVYLDVEYVVSTYTEGDHEWHEGTYFDTYERAVVKFLERSRELLVD